MFSPIFKSLLRKLLQLRAVLISLLLIITVIVDISDYANQIFAYIL